MVSSAAYLAGSGRSRGEAAAAMAGFDDPGVYYSEPFFSEDVSEDGEISRTAAVRRFKEFIKTFLDHENIYCYR